jgi:hypothetical protein
LLLCISGDTTSFLCCKACCAIASMGISNAITQMTATDLIKLFMGCYSFKFYVKKVNGRLLRIFILDVFFAKIMILLDKQEVNKVFFSTRQQIKHLW